MKPICLRILGDSTILVGDVEVAPSASHVFALLLVLALAPPEGVSRREIQDLLFADTDDEKASHRLRQLFYRLRQLGVVLRTVSGGALQVANPIGEPTIHASGGQGSERPKGVLRALPHYRPRFPSTFLTWLDHARDRIEREAQSRLLRELREAHRRQDWTTTSGIADTVLVTDPLNEEVAVAGAESRAMLGQQDRALEIADRFVRESDGDHEAAKSMRQLRARIARTTLSHRNGTLRGREECLAFLADQWKQAAVGGGRMSLVVGPPGMGKSRVADAFAAKVRLGGGRVITYRCDRQASQHPLSLFSAVLKDLQALPGSLGISPTHCAALGRLSPFGSDSIELPSLTSVEERRSELQCALIDLLEAVSNERALLMIVDDVHLLDDASCEVMRTLGETDNNAAVLVVGFTRPRARGATSLSSARRGTSYSLPPLTEAQSRDLLSELGRESASGEDHVQWALAQAKGNPFYLYALASIASAHDALPAHIRSLAVNSYFSLKPEARTILESCLLLDTLATLKRVVKVAAIDESTFLDALRQLEELDLVHFADGRLSGPHAILDEAIRKLVPGTVTASLHARIAEALADECARAGYPLSLAWAAVKSWLLAGDAQAAVALACRSARAAADLGEPQAGAELLHQIPRTLLPPDCQRQLLDDLSQLARAGNCQSLLADALRDRMSLAISLQETSQVQATIKLAIIANIRRNGGAAANSFEDISSILYNPTFKKATRVEAGRRIIALADANLDSTLADHIYAYLCSECGISDSVDASSLNTLLVYHTTFGDAERALAIAANAAPDDYRDSLCTNACLALTRLGYYSDSKRLAVATFDSLSSRGIFGAAEIALGLITDADVALGDLASARQWIDRWEKLSEQRTSYQSVCPGYLASTFFILLADCRYADAQDIYKKHQWGEFLSDPRHRAVLLAHSLILEHRRGQKKLSVNDVCELRELYDRGRSLGAQDSCVEALWCAYATQGRTADASLLLREYLSTYRRERGTPEWSLRNTTAGDPAWSQSAKASRATLKTVSAAST